MPASMDDGQQPNFKHYCRVCKKGFTCGRALGGHMRAHGIGDENGSLSDYDPASDWEDKVGASGNKRMYQLRTNPNRLKSCRTCENCGKEFSSWKSFLEHGKCSWDDASDSFVSSPDSDGEEHSDGRRAGGWSKRRRSLRSKVGCVSSNYIQSDEDDILLARCLVQLANTTVDPPVAEPEESSDSASREEERRNPNLYFRTNFVDKAKGVSKGLFECKACNKVFNSHQALGGHRASHKKVKGCYATKQDQAAEHDNMINSGGGRGDNHYRQDNMDEGIMLQSKPNLSFQFEQGPASHAPALVGAARKKSKVHECSICHRVFTSGQALGGHKRCHWITSNSGLPATSASLPKFLLQDNMNEPIIPQTRTAAAYVSNKLDLNVVPAWADMSRVRRDPHNPLSFEVSTEMHLKPWMAPQKHFPTQLQLIKNKGNIDIVNNTVRNEINGGDKTTVEDEADSKVQLAKLSDLNDLKEMGSNGNSSQWLQVGIGASATGKAAASAAAAVAPATVPAATASR